ncbi:putative bifunctional diguanylate cyclase/phosphodiesterase [uncultured Methylobacterium sp.]|uniref:putative bifunctional diguanylate cyclase/phosphodiesterase n=1 Tax=uncultured Methylobacterium sp. TaxID=157278 RepID=UPI0035CAD136
MYQLSLPTDEAGRLAALAQYDFQAYVQDADLTQLVEDAKAMFAVSYAKINIVQDKDVIVLYGPDTGDSSVFRSVSFCAHVAAENAEIIVLDARTDRRFCENPLVSDDGLRFYAGFPLRAPSGHVIGALCLVDTEPRTAFSETEFSKLQELACFVAAKLDNRRLDVARRNAQLRLERIAAASSESIICVDQHGRITFWNGAAEALFGFRADKILGLPVGEIITGLSLADRDGEPEAAYADRLQACVARNREMLARRSNGSVLPVEIALSAWIENGCDHLAIIVRDVSERRAHEVQLCRSAHLDPLTELPNRTVLGNHIAAAIQVGRPLAILMLDLDNFKDVNDTLGHPAGDTVLKQAAERLLSCLRVSDMAARLGGDEFAIVLPDVRDHQAAATVAERIIQAIAVPFHVDDHAVDLGVSIGIAMCPAHGRHADELLANADMALYQAKADGRSCHQVFRPALKEAAHRRRSYAEELRRAVEAGEFVLFYQPQVSLAHGGLIGAEALIRWQHPKNGLVSPGAFLPALESSRYAAEVGDWVLRTACAQAAAWRDQGAPTFQVGVNLFAAQFRRGDLARKVKTALEQTGLPASCLELEITENIILRNDAALIDPLRELHGAGVSIAFDDYGTGYASFSLLKGFPLTRLKIDQVFVREMCRSAQDAAIVRTVLYLGRSFGLDVIAEGIETEEQSAFLQAEGCQEAQGYLYGKPVPAQEFADRFLVPASRPAGTMRAA